MRLGHSVVFRCPRTTLCAGPGYPRCRLSPFHETAQVPRETVGAEGKSIRRCPLPWIVQPASTNFDRVATCAPSPRCSLGRVPAPDASSRARPPRRCIHEVRSAAPAWEAEPINFRQPYNPVHRQKTENPYDRTRPRGSAEAAGRVVRCPVAAVGKGWHGASCFPIMG